MKITLSQFFKLPIYSCFYRIIFDDIVIFDEDSEEDLLENCILPQLGNYIIDTIECSNGNIYYDGAFITLRIESSIED